MTKLSENENNNLIQKNKNKKLLIDQSVNLKFMQEVFKEELEFYSPKVKVSLEDSINYLICLDFKVKANYFSLKKYFCQFS